MHNLHLCLSTPLVMAKSIFNLSERISNVEKEQQIEFKKNLLSSDQFTLKMASVGKVVNIWAHIHELLEHLQKV